MRGSIPRRSRFRQTALGAIWRKNAATGPALWQDDSTVENTFHVTERVGAIFRAEAFNLFNGGRADRKQFAQAVNDALSARWGAGKWLLANSEIGMWLNYDLLVEKKLTRAEVEGEAARAAAALPYIARVYTREQFLAHTAMADTVDQYMQRGFYADRSADVWAVQKPYWLFGTEGTSHGTPYNYDSHVPLIFWGAGVREGVYPETVGISDVAPTLAAFLRIATPTGSVGRILPEIVPPLHTLPSRAASPARTSKGTP